MKATQHPEEKRTYSLLVPCYNAEKYIGCFLKNIESLSRTFDEVIFYDDASIDHTYELLTRSGYLVIKGAVNMGAGYSRNQLAQAAKGDYIHFHDIDDLLAPDYLLKTAKIAEDTGVDVVLCNVDWFDETREKILISWKYSNQQINQNSVAYTISNPIGGINGLYKKSKFKETGGFNEYYRIWEDADLHVQLAAQQASFYILEEVLSYSVRHNLSASIDQDYGWQARLFFLQHYADLFIFQSVQHAVGRQAQVAASNLVIYKRFKEAQLALNLSEKCGVKVPDNGNFIWKIFKFFLPKSIRIKLRLVQLKNAFN